MSYITIKNDEQKNYGLVRKTDLNLRAKYPELQTLFIKLRTTLSSFISKTERLILVLSKKNLKNPLNQFFFQLQFLQENLKGKPN